MKKAWQVSGDWIMIALGAMLLAFGVAWFADPAHIAPGGSSGLSIIVKDLTARLGWGVPLAVTNLAINIPLFAVSWYQRGFKFVAKSMFATLVMTGGLALAEFCYRYTGDAFADISSDTFLSALTAGVLTGVGIGVVLRYGATTGGTDMLASIICYKSRRLKISVLMFSIDACIIASSIFVFGVKAALYAMASVGVTSFMIDLIVEGVRKARCVYIISNRPAEIADMILHRLDRGATYLNARGAYSGTERDVLYVVVPTKEVRMLVQLVKEIDPMSFVTVNDVREVLGEGFTSTHDEIRRASSGTRTNAATAEIATEKDAADTASVAAEERGGDDA